MLLCGSCNRAKSWSCEHCGNSLAHGGPEACAKCYWANPTDYAHVALRPIRRADIQWESEEVIEYDRLRELSNASSETVPGYVKRLLRGALTQRAKSSR
jgi:hypothetical protein